MTAKPFASAAWTLALLVLAGNPLWADGPGHQPAHPQPQDSAAHAPSQPTGTGPTAQPADGQGTAEPSVEQLARRIEQMLDQADQADQADACPDHPTDDHRQPAASARPQESPADSDRAESPSSGPDQAARSTDPAAQSDRNQPAIRFQFDGVPYLEVVRRFAQTAGRPLIGADQPLTGSLTFFDAQPYTYGQALDTLNLLLSMRGYVLLEDGRFLRLVKTDQVRQVPLRLLRGTEQPAPPPRPGELVTVVIPLQIIDAQQAAEALQPMVSAGYGSVSALPNGRSIVITDRADNIQRIRRLLAAIDLPDSASPVPERLWTYQVQHGRAADIVKTIKALYGSTAREPASSKSQPKKEEDIRRERNLQAMRQRQAQAQVRARTGSPVARPLIITADDHSNRILMIADQTTISLVETLVRQIDVPQARTPVEIHLLNLEKSQAAQLVRTLQPTVDLMNKQAGGGIVVSAIDQSNQLLVTAPPDRIQALEQAIVQLDRQLRRDQSLRIFHLQHARAEELSQVIRSALASGGPVGSGDYARYYAYYQARYGSSSRSAGRSSLKVTADPRLNALIVHGSAADLQAAGELVATLDVPARQDFQPIHLIRLESGDAAALAKTLTDLLGKDADQVQVRADPSSNTVLVRAAPDKREVLEKILKQLDRPADRDAREVRLLPLQHASARQVADLLTQFFAAPSSRSTVPSSAYYWRSRYESSSSSTRRTDPPRIAAAPGDRVLVVEGTDEQLQRIEQMLAGIDQPASASARHQVRSYQLSKSQATDLAKALSNLFSPTDRHGQPADPDAPRFQADQATNQLIISASPEQFERIEKTIHEIERQPIVSTTTRTFRLAHAKASEVAQVLRSVFGIDQARSSSSRPSYRSYYSWEYRNYWNNPYRDSDSSKSSRTFLNVRIAALDQTNDLVVQGPEEALALAEQIIRSIDQPNASSQRRQTLRVVQLKNARADSLAEAMTRVLEQRRTRSRSSTSSPQDMTVTVTAEPNSNSVLVRGPVERVEQIVEMIGRLDEQSSSTGLQVRLYRLDNADAAELADNLRAVLSALPGPGRSASSSRYRRSSSSPTFSVTADTRTNTLIVSATQAGFAVVEQLIHRLDAAPDKPARDVTYIALENADAFDLSIQLDAMFSDRKGDQRPIIQADGLANALTVIASAEDLAEIRQVVAKLDAAAPDNSRTVRVLTVGQMRADKVAAMLQSLYPRIANVPVEIEKPSPAPASPSTRPEPQAPKNPDPSGGASSRATDHPPSRSPQTSERAASERAAAPVLHPDDPGPDGPLPCNDEPAQPPVTIGVDRTANALVVTATRKQLEEIENLLLQLQLSAATEEQEIRVYKIASGDPQSVATMLDRLFNTRRLVQPPPRRPQDSRQSGKGPGGQRSTGRGQQPQQPARPQVQIVQNIAVVAEPRTSSVIVRAQPVQLDLIGQLIQQIDVVSTAVNEVRIFPLKNTDAAEIAANIQQLLAASGPGRISTARPDSRSPASLRAQAVGKQMKLRLGQTLAQLDPADTIRVTSNARTNALVVSAPAPVMTVIGQLVQELDQSAAQAQAPAIRLYPLRHADPQATVTALRDIFGAAGPATGRRGTSRSRPAGSTEPEIRFTADQAGRLVIVAAPADQQELIASLIDDLDRAQAEGVATLRVYRIQYTQADEMARALAATFPGATGRQSAVRITADRSANALVVRGSAEDHQRIAELVAQMDTSPAMKLPVQLIALENADPVATAALLSRAFGDLQAAAQRRGRTSRTTGPAVLIEADPESHMLLVRAEPDVFQQVKQMAGQLDQASRSAGSSVYVIALDRGDATTVASMITSLYRQEQQAARSAQRKVEPLAVAADPRANALVLATTASMYDKVSTWVRQIEQMKPARGVSRLITLQYADPAEVQQAINQLFSPAGPAQPTGRTPTGRPSRSRPPAPSSSSTGRVETTVLAQQRAILVNASPDDFKDIETLVRMLDTKAGQVRPLHRVVALQNADNRRVAQALMQLYRQAGPRNADPAMQVVVTALQQSDALLVTAPQQRMDEVLQLIEQLDSRQVSAKVDYRVFTLQHVQPTKILAPLQQLIRPLQQTRPGEPITLQADERTRSIIVTARPGVFEQIEQIVKTLDTPPAFATADILVYPLKKADATQLARVLNDMLRPSAANQVSPEARMLQEQVTRLRLHDKQGQTLPELDLTRPIKILADPIQPRQQGSNALIVSSTPDNLKAMAALIELMDKAPLTDEAVVKLVHLEHADAQSVMTILRQVFTQGRQAMTGNPNTSVQGRAEPPTLSGQALARPFNVSCDLRTNTLVLSGSKESVGLAELIVADLDRQEGRFVTQVRLFRLQYADAARLQPILAAVFAETTAAPGAEGIKTQVTRLRTMVEQFQPKQTQLPKGRAALTIQADPASQTLVVAARSDVMPLIADVIKTLDIPGAGPNKSVRIFPLVHADATRLRQVIADLYTGPNAQAIRDQDKPTITVDTRTNVLVVAASDETYKTIARLLRSLDADQPIDFHDIRLIALKNATAEELAVSLQKLMDARVQRQQSLGVKDAEALRMTILADPRSNALLVSGSLEGYQLVRSLAEQLDNASPALVGQVQLFPLRHANAGTMAASLSNLFAQRYQAARTEDVRRQQPVILADLRTNALMVSANADDTRVLKGLLARLDRKLEDPAVQLVVIPLQHNDAGVLAPTIKQIFDARLESMTPEGQPPSPQDRVDVAADSLANALIVSASKENLQLLHQLLDKVDVEPPMETGVVRLYHLEHADAAQVSTVLRDLVSQGLYKPGRAALSDNPAIAAQEKVSISPDQRTNTLIISASRENFAVIEQIIRGLDRFGGQELGRIEAFPLKHADAQATADTLQKLFDAKQQAEQDLGQSTRALKPTVTADSRTNSLLVSADKPTLAMVRSLLARLDTNQATKVTEIRVFPLQHANADELAQLLNSTLNEKPQPLNAENPDRQTLLQFISRQPGGSELVTTVVQQALLINADPRSNALIVAAPVENLPLLEKLVTALDNANPRVAEIRVFNLKNADATQMADVLRQLFRLEAQANGSDKTIRYTLVGGDPNGGKTGGDRASAVLGSAEQDALNVTVDVRTNSLLVGGTRHYVDLVSRVIEQLDASPAQERQTSLYRLRHAQASQIQAALRDFLDQERQRLEQALGQEGLGAATRLLEREVAIVAEENTNTLLLSASPRYFQTIEQMIRTLDQPPPQVLIQAQLIQLNLDDETDVGLEWQYTNGLGDSATASIGTDYGLAAAARQFGGFSVAVTGGDLGFFLRALKNRGHARILSQPQILAADNQTGTINVGQSIPLITSSQVTENDRVINTITYRDVGINLSITPRISPDGMVSVAVEPEVSSLSDSNIEVTEGVSAPIIDQIRATTTVSVRDGQSILIGGLVRASQSLRRKGVPLLGDLPLLGALFSDTSTSLERREILIILTPRILRNVKDGDLMTRSQIGSSQAYKQVVEQALEKRLYEKLKPQADGHDDGPADKPGKTVDLEQQMRQKNKGDRP